MKKIITNTKVDDYLSFIFETEELKQVERRTKVIGTDRRENSAEHSWQLALLAYALKDLLPENVEIDINRVVLMLLVHDLPEAKVGDTFFYSTERQGEAKKDLYEKENKAAEEIFSTLPKSVSSELLSLWQEYEERKTLEAKFAHAIDRIIPPLQNYYENGGTWKEFSVSYQTALEKNVHVKEGSEEISNFINEVLRIALSENLFSDN